METWLQFNPVACLLIYTNMRNRVNFRRRMPRPALFQERLLSRSRVSAIHFPITRSHSHLIYFVISCDSFLFLFPSAGAHTKMARILLSLAIPSHMAFLLVTEFVNKRFYLTPSFILIYLMIGALHVAFMLQMAYNFVHWLWKVGINPDNTAIPFLTASADLIGSLLLFTAFISLYLAGDPNAYDASRVANVTSIVTASQHSHVG